MTGSATFPQITTLATAAVLALDFLLPAEAAVGTLLCLPVLFSAAGREPRHVWSAAILAVAAMMITAARDLAAGAAAGSVAVAELVVVLAVAASTVVALSLQARRRDQPANYRFVVHRKRCYGCDS